jgi:hypothetical protein
MDPRKTVVIANFDEVIRAAREPSSAPPAAAPEPGPVPEWGVQTLAWPSGGEAKDAVPAPRERSSDIRETLAQATKAAKASPTVLIGRTVVTGSEPRGLSMAKTQVWRREVTVSHEIDAVTDGERQRAEVHVDEAVMEHLSAEVWAGQAQQGSHLMVTTVRRSIVDVSTSSLVETRRNDPQPTIIAKADRITRADSLVKTEVLARAADDALVRIPQLVRVPEAKTIRIACLALCIASAGAIAMWPPAVHKASSPAQPTAASVGLGAAAARNGQSEPVEVESTWRPRTAPVGAADPRREKSVEAPVVADSERAQRVAAGEDESKVGPARKQVAAAVKSPGAGAAAGAGKTAPASSSASPRAAIDALISGKQQLALARYRALAKSNPSEPAYEAAARILEDAVSRDADQQ